MSRTRTRMLALAVVSLGLSAVVAMLAHRMLAARMNPKSDTSQVVNAVQQLALGARLTETDGRVVTWPRSAPLEGACTDTTQVVGRGVIAAMVASEPILESKLAPKEGGGGITFAIPEGMRAVAVRVNEVIGVAG